MYECTRPEEWLPHVRNMLEAADAIVEFVGEQSKDEFSSDARTYSAAMLQIVVIAEAANKLPEEVRQQAEEIPWHMIRGMRNRIVHGYHDVDGDIVWNTVSVAVPKLTTILHDILADHGKE